MTDVAQTSIDSYHAFNAEELSHMQHRVLAILKRHGPLSNKQISERGDIPVNSITPRCKELRELGLVVKQGTRYDERTGRHETVWALSRREVL
jgi:DNA-binding MarR family transcriptional regulator